MVQINVRELAVQSYDSSKDYNSMKMSRVPKEADQMAVAKTRNMIKRENCQSREILRDLDKTSATSAPEEKEKEIVIDAELDSTPVSMPML